MAERIYSQVYPHCEIIRNQDNAFITHYSVPHNYMTLSPNHPSNQIFSEAIKKLLKQLQLNDQQLWICQQKSFPTVRVYLTEPKYYMVSPCCRKCVFVQFYHNISGKIVCSCCEKVCFQFVHALEKQKQGCQKIFKNRNESVIAKKQIVRKLISADKHRYKKLDKVFRKKMEKTKIVLGQFIIEMKDQSDKKSVLLEKKEQVQDFPERHQDTKNTILQIFS